MTDPVLAECAAHLARDFHETETRVAARNSNGRTKLPGWDSLSRANRDQMISTMYTMLYAGRILCPLPEHRIKISLCAATQATEDEHAGRT